MTSHWSLGKTARRVGSARRWTVLALALLAAGCGKDKPPPPPPPPTLVNVTVNATAAVNATPDGAGAPVLMRIYQLGSSTSFDQAEFFRIYKDDAGALGSDLLKKEEFLIAPGAKKTINLKPSDAVHAIGVFAAYRDFQKVFWRGSAEVPAHKTTEVTVTADLPGIKLDTALGKPGSP